MGRKVLLGLIGALSVILLGLCVMAAGLGMGWLGPERQVFQPETEPFPEETTLPTVPPTVPPTTAAADPPATEPETEPQPEVFRLTFAGDCTLGTMYQYYNAASCFPAVVGDDYDYPFANVQPWFGEDDFTMVNLEGPLTDEGTPAEKEFAFRGSPEFVKILTQGGVECVSIANNHSRDFGQVGYDNTKTALDSVGMAYAEDEDSCLVVTERGLKIGVFAVAFSVDKDDMARSIEELREAGAELVIVSFHFGNEGTYRHTGDQESYAHAAIDAGANIVFGHHPHVLQEIESYHGGIIYYSLGNFAFGGNGHPSDFDTAMISQEVIREVDGTVRLGDCTPIPCSLSSVDYTNNYQPTPAEKDSERYTRVLSKLDGTFDGPDLTSRTGGGSGSYAERPTEAPTEGPTEAPTDEPTEAPTEEPTEAPVEAPTEEAGES